MQPEGDKRLLVIGVSVVLSIILFIVWFFTFGPATKTSIEIFVVPSDSKVTIDGKPSKAGQVSVKKGKHTFEGTRQYFGAAKQEVDTKDLGEAKTVYLALSPNTPEAIAYLNSHPEEQARYERISGAEFSALQERILKDYPITAKLPYQTLDYKIDFDINKDKKVVFLVKFYMPKAVTPGSDLYKQQLLSMKSQALSYLQKNGVDTKKALITYDPDPSAL